MEDRCRSSRGLFALPFLGYLVRYARDTHLVNPKPMTPHQDEVLRAVAYQRIHLDLLHGTLEPHLLNGQDVTGPPGSRRSICRILMMCRQTWSTSHR